MSFLLRPGEGMHDRKVMSFVDWYWEQNYRPPSMREINDACNISSTNTTRGILRRLARGGRYILADREARGIIPVWVKNAIKKGAATHGQTK